MLTHPAIPHTSQLLPSDQSFEGVRALGRHTGWIEFYGTWLAGSADRALRPNPNELASGSAATNGPILTLS